MDSTRIHKALEEAVRRLSAEFRPVAIYHFGSSADKAAASPNDLDLLIVVEQASENSFDRGARAYRALRGLGVPVDVQVYTREEFDRRSGLPVSFERTVRDKGRVVYAA